MGWSYFATTPMMSSSRITRYSVPSTFTAWPENLPNRMRSPTLTSSGRTLPSSRIFPLPTAMTSPWAGLARVGLCCDVVGNDDAACGFALLIETLHHNAVVQGTDFHHDM